MESLIMNNASTAQHNDLLANRISRVGGAGKEQDDPEMVAQELESLFATLLVSEMRKGLGDGFFGGGAGSDTFNGWFDEEIGASLSARGSLGLADVVHESLIREKAAADAEVLRNAKDTGELPATAELPGVENGGSL